MPPKARITREMVVKAAYEIAREEGADSINARAVAQRLGCSTQPVMYCFGTMDELKRAVYQKADEYQSACLMEMRGGDPMVEIGLNYIRFAVEEKHLFRLLFESDGFAGKSVVEITSVPEIEPVVGILAQEAELSMVQAEKVFKYLFLFVHGYACMYASNDMPFHEEEITEDLSNMFYGAIAAMKREDE